MKTLADFVRESNAIEGIHRENVLKEVVAHEKLLKRNPITIDHLIEFVSIVQPGARLCNTSEPAGLLSDIYTWNMIISPFTAHRRYTSYCPFTDGNRRSGRALWLAHMKMNGELDRALELGFLECWYRQSLEEG